MKTRKRSTRERKTEEVKQMADTETKSNRGAKATMTPVNLADIPVRTTPGKAKPFVDEFMASGAEAARADGGTKGFASTLRRYIKEQGLTGVEVKTVQGQTYIVRS
jgi:hypothetical protein